MVAYHTHLFRAKGHRKTREKSKPQVLYLASHLVHPKVGFTAWFFFISFCCCFSCWFGSHLHAFPVCTQTSSSLPYICVHTTGCMHFLIINQLCHCTCAALTSSRHFSLLEKKTKGPCLHDSNVASFCFKLWPIQDISASGQLDVYNAPSSDTQWNPIPWLGWPKPRDILGYHKAFLYHSRGVAYGSLSTPLWEQGDG